MKIRVTFEMGNGVEKSTIVEADNYLEAQSVIDTKFSPKSGRPRLYKDADSSGVFEVKEHNVLCVSYEEAKE